MSRLQLVILHLSTAVLAATGIVFAGAKYGIPGDGPLAAALRTLQPYALPAHIVAAPVLVFALGWITSSHIVPKLWNAMAGPRYTGLAATWVAVPLVVTGYALQVFSAEALRQLMTVGHWISAAAFIGGYVAHVAVKNQTT